MTLNGVMTIIGRYFAELGSFGAAITSEWLKIDP